MFFVFVFVFSGRNQVTIGIVPIGFKGKSSESALSFFPMAIANCKEQRQSLRSLINNLNVQKATIKEQGMKVDGKKYNIRFTVTIDYKVLLLLLVKINNEEFVLGGRGFLVEFCFVCDAIRAKVPKG